MDQIEVAEGRTKPFRSQMSSMARKIFGHRSSLALSSIYRRSCSHASSLCLTPSTEADIWRPHTEALQQKQEDNGGCGNKECDKGV